MLQKIYEMTSLTGIYNIQYLNFSKMSVISDGIYNLLVTRHLMKSDGVNNLLATRHLMKLTCAEILF